MVLILLLVAFWMSFVFLNTAIMLPIDLFAAFIPPRWVLLLGLTAILSFLMSDS